MLIHKVKRLDINQEIEINFHAVDAIGDYYPMEGKPPHQKKSIEPDPKSCVLVMRSGLVLPINMTVAKVANMMKQYRG